MRECPVPEYVLMVGDLLDHGDNVHDAELDLCPDLHDAAIHRDELLRRHADPNRTHSNYLGKIQPSTSDR